MQEPHLEDSLGCVSIDLQWQRLIQQNSTCRFEVNPMSMSTGGLGLGPTIPLAIESSDYIELD